MSAEIGDANKQHFKSGITNLELPPVQ